MAAMKITVSGRSYANACASDVSTVPADQEWPDPVLNRIGTGTQWVYEVTEEQARQIQAHLAEVADKFMESTDKVDREIGRALRKDVTRIKKLLPSTRLLPSGP